jgi:hypothetical protein
MATQQPKTPTDAQNAPQTALTTPAQGGSLALPASLLASLAEEAKEAAAKERPSISKISLKSGVMSYGGAPMMNNEVEAIILSASYRNAWYATKFDPNNIKNPNCFAFSEEDEGMAPHENVAEPVHATCEGCTKAEWGSAGENSRGKACKQTRRLVLLPSNALDEGIEKVKTAELAILDLPVTSVKNYSQFINTLAASAGVPAYAAVCKVKVVPDMKTQFKVMFQAMRVVPSVELLDALKSRRPEALRISLQPYDETALMEENYAEGSANKGGSKKPAKF